MQGDPCILFIEYETLTPQVQLIAKLDEQEGDVVVL